MSGETALHTATLQGSNVILDLDELVDYAKSLDSPKDAEVIELMLYRVLGRRLTPEAIGKIAEIQERFKPKPPTVQPTIGQFINNGSITDIHDNREVKPQTLQAV